EIAKALPTVITPEGFTRMVLTALSTDKKLELCTPQSFLGAMMTAAQLGLEPNTPLGQAYLIPYKNKGVLECQFQIGYKGLIDLAYRSGEVEIIQAQVVYENDEFDYELGLDPKLKHKPAKENRGNPIYYYAIFKTKSGGYGFEVMSIHDIKVHAKKYSQSYSSEYSPWQKNFDEMAKKTVLKRVLKYAPLKSDFVRAVAMDETVKKEISDDMYTVPAVELDETEYIIAGEEIVVEEEQK
ncbi:MAG TPA: recombinase RecT, partial [Clostridia bacterium]|nr:recombinase RecT [Clostridia bacterium]